MVSNSSHDGFVLINDTWKEYKHLKKNPSNKIKSIFIGLNV